MRQTMRQFIAECLLVSEKQDLYGVKKCTGFSLVHVRGGQQVELKTIKIGAKAWDTKELANLFETVAENFAGGVPGVQQFQLLAFYDDNDQPQSFYPFRKAGEQEGEGIVTEAPTGSGPQAQFMRHYEADRRITTQYANSLFSHMERMLERAVKRIEQLESQEQHAIELAKTAIFEQVTKEHERRKEIMRLERAEKDREAILRLLPSLANKVVGKDVFPQATADSALLEHLAESLDQEQVAKLASILRPEQWGLLADRILQILEKKEKREKERQELLRKNGSITLLTEKTSENEKVS
jgi:hypothetical protein